MISPCKDCQRREAGCHACCGDYKEFQKKNEAVADARQKENDRFNNPYRPVRMKRMLYGVKSWNKRRS